MRVFPDTNVLLSGFFGVGLCAELLARLLEGEHPIIIGEPVARELVRVAQQKFRVPPESLAYALEVLRRQTLAPAAGGKVAEIRDPADARVMTCALAAKADLFVTGDQALLARQELRGLPILSPREAWERLFAVQ